MKLKNKIEYEHQRIKGDLDNVEKIIETNLSKLRDNYSTINKLLLNQKNKHFLFKKSVENESYIDNFMSKTKEIITKNNALVSLRRNIASIRSDNKKDIGILKNQIKGILKKIKDFESQIKKQDSQINHELTNQLVYQNYIINPSLEGVEKNNELYQQKELINKFTKEHREAQFKNKELLKDINKHLQILQKLKKDKGISEVMSSKNEKESSTFEEYSIGSVDQEFVNSIESPKFLRKVKQNSKISNVPKYHLDLYNFSPSKVKNQIQKKKNKEDKKYLLNPNKGTSIEKKVVPLSIDKELEMTTQEIEKYKKEIEKNIAKEMDLKEQKRDLISKIEKANQAIARLNAEIKEASSKEVPLKTNENIVNNNEELFSISSFRTKI